jgi:hypothetical protein
MIDAFVSFRLASRSLQVLGIPGMPRCEIVILQ